jgi:hypothetical protein
MTRKGERSVGPTVRAVARWLAGSDDSGATLILALIFITVASLVVAAILSFVDTSMRTTIAVRSEAGQAAAADGAAQIAINAIRTGTYAGLTGTQCLGASNTVNLSNFYTTSDGTKYSAAVQCAKDDTDSQAGGGYFGGKPSYSILALGLLPGAGITLDRGLFAGGHGFTLNGDVYSNSTISVSPSMTTDGTVKARGNCSGTITAAAKQCNTGTPVGDPNYAMPSGTPTQKTAPNCTRFGGAYQVLTFDPGLYTNAGDLNNLTGPLTLLCNKPILKFNPGVYYFDFSGLSTTWQISDGYVVGGTPAKALNSSIDMPGMCVSPIPPSNPAPAGWTPPAGGQGVTFVFGGQSKMDVTNNGHVELCGSYSTGSPPLAIYGNKTDIKDGSGKILVHAGCTACDVVQAESLSSGEIVIQGTTYVPTGDVNIAVLWNKGQQFNAGVVARSFSVQAWFSSSGDIGPVSALPDDPSPGRTIVYLKVYVCAGAGPCSTAVGVKNQLGVKVGIGDPQGVPTASKRQITVYNWSVQRT